MWADPTVITYPQRLLALARKLIDDGEFGVAVVVAHIACEIAVERSLSEAFAAKGQARLEDDAQCLLVIIGATPEGKKELVGLIDGVRESAQSWRELLLDLKRRGLAMAPELAVADGALGFWQAVEEVWPKTRGQRCWVHKTANVLNKLPKSQQSKA